MKKEFKKTLTCGELARILAENQPYEVFYGKCGGKSVSYALYPTFKDPRGRLIHFYLGMVYTGILNHMSGTKILELSSILNFLMMLEDGSLVEFYELDQSLMKEKISCVYTKQDREYWKKKPLF